jgi:hypothetical protein
MEKIPLDYTSSSLHNIYVRRRPRQGARDERSSEAMDGWTAGEDRYMAIWRGEMPYDRPDEPGDEMSEREEPADGVVPRRDDL